MKTAGKILLSIVVVLAVLFIALELYLDRAILKGFNAVAPTFLGVPASLEDANISLVRGDVSIKNLHIGNPEGFKTDGLFDLASIGIRMDLASLFTDTIVIKAILIDGLELTYEKGLLNNNLNAFIEQLAGGPEEKSKPDAPKPEKKDSAKPGKKVVIEKLAITGSRMNFSITGAAALTGGGSLPLPLPPITLTDLGKEKDGVSIGEMIQSVLEAITGAVGTVLSGSAELIGKSFSAVGDGLSAVGEGALDVGSSVVGGVLHSGKAIGGAIGGVVKGAADAVTGVATDADPETDDE